MKVFKGIAEKDKSTMGWNVGFKLHLLCNEKGEILNFILTKANVDDRNENVIDTLADKVFGKLYADKGYISQSLFGKLFDEGIHIVTGPRSNMKQRLMPMLKKVGKEPEYDLNGNVIVPRYECVTSHTARRTGITNMYLSHRHNTLQMMSVSGHKTHKTLMDNILSACCLRSKNLSCGRDSR